MQLKQILHVNYSYCYQSVSTSLKQVISLEAQTETMIKRSTSFSKIFYSHFYHYGTICTTWDGANGHRTRNASLRDRHCNYSTKQHITFFKQDLHKQTIEKTYTHLRHVNSRGYRAHSTQSSTPCL